MQQSPTKEPKWPVITNLETYSHALMHIIISGGEGAGIGAANPFLMPLPFPRPAVLQVLPYFSCESTCRAMLQNLPASASSLAAPDALFICG